MTVRRSLASLAAMLGLTFTLAGGVVANPLPEAQAAYDRGLAAHRAGDVASAVIEWEAAAEGGHTGAAWLLANLYDKGVGGVVQNDARAYEYYLQAARGGQPEAAYRLGLIYLEGNEAIGLKRNYVEALKSFEVAALLPRADAQFQLGMMHRNGLGVPLDRTEGLRWIILSAKKRYSPALAELGRIYFEGEGVAADRLQGWSFLMLANRFGTAEERRAADELFEKYANRMKTGEREKALEMADAWVAANSGS
ncbi:MAG: tetratricopeptide repeat protein [Parvibaculum sp.]|uniref:tetratricopeptide repeat protein n=1 Tax=Parvibaculum sp. TaxID=2024848 RepID=UPI002720DBFE|nr:tetratricopeptide repeat protein [Parvibaculum sp.]MDO8840288.1 tetratricopeptide repeat protein [Parvibaculum sp.]